MNNLLYMTILQQTEIMFDIYDFTLIDHQTIQSIIQIHLIILIIELMHEQQLLHLVQHIQTNIFE